MDLFEAIFKRHSYRGSFQDKEVSRTDLKKIIEAGLAAPSGNNAQTTTFVVIDEKSILNQIQKMHPTNKAMQQACAMIACIIDKNPKNTYEGYSFQVEDCAVAVENMLLSLVALGYAGVWVDGWLRLEERYLKIGQLLNVPENKIVRVLLPIGIPKENIEPKEKKAFSQRAAFNDFRQIKV